MGLTYSQYVAEETARRRAAAEGRTIELAEPLPPGKSSASRTVVSTSPAPDTPPDGVTAWYQIDEDGFLITDDAGHPVFTVYTTDA